MLIEIGSGISTRFARRAVSDLALRTRIRSIDPCPREDIDKICDDVVRLPVEVVDLAVFDSLDSGDVLFFDGSHRAFQNTDVTIFFTEILPRLKPGVIVGIHDIFLPYDYPPEWYGRFYNEQYLLACYLLGGDSWRILLPNYYVSKQPDLRSILDPIWTHPALSGIWYVGGAFWMTKRS